MGFRSLFSRKKKLDSNNSAGSRSSSVGSRSRSDSARSRSRSRSDPAGNYSSHAEELEQVFNKFDANGDGKISSSELGSIMAGLGHLATEEDLRRLIREVDKDGDGFIDLEEFVEMNTKGIDSDKALENLKDAFSVYDIDGDGSISAEELQSVMRSLGDECSIPECRRMISGADCDGDGKISFEEFKIMMMAGTRFDSAGPQR